MSLKLKIIMLIMLIILFRPVTNTFNLEDVDVNNKIKNNFEIIETIDGSTELTTSESDYAIETVNSFQGGFRPNIDADSPIKYTLSSSYFSLYFLESSIVMKQTVSMQENSISQGENKLESHDMITLSFPSSNLVTPVAQNPSSSYSNHFKGSDESKWISKIPFFTTLVYENLYDNIDLVYTFNKGQLKYDIYVHPGGLYENIQFYYVGPVKLEHTKNGMEMSSLSNGDLLFTDTNPINYVGSMNSNEVQGTFQMLNDQSYTFKLESYNRDELLIIDPILEFSTLLGGSVVDEANSIAVDENGYIYITGVTADTPSNFPATTGSFNEAHNGATDVFVTKLSPDGTSLIFSTFIGGENTDVGNSIAVSGNGEVIVTGYTIIDAITFPTTLGAYDQTHNGAFDAFVTILTSDGSSLSYSTFIGGSNNDYGNSIHIDDQGNILVVGTTEDTASTDFPTQPGAYNLTHNGLVDAFVAKFSSTGTLLDSTFLGGSGYDSGNSIVSDTSGNYYVTGYTVDDVTDFPTTMGVFQDTHLGGADVFVGKLNSDLSDLLYSTLLGSSNNDYGNSLAVNNLGEIFVTGYTQGDFPTTPNAYDESYNNQNDVFLTKLSDDGTSLIFSTIIGGSGDDVGTSLVIDSIGDVYVTGYTTNSTSNFPTTLGALDTIHNGQSDAFVVKLAGNGSKLIYSTYIGGSGNDEGNSIQIDDNNNPYITGVTEIHNIRYPTTPFVFDETHNGADDVFVTNIQINPVTIAETLALEAYQELLNGNPVTHLIWNRPQTVEPINEYRVFRRTLSGTFNLLATSSSEDFYDRTAQVDIEYYYYISFVISGIESIRSFVKSITLFNPSVPSSPLGLSAIVGKEFVTLNWSSPTDDGGVAISEYYIYRGTTSGNYDLIFVTTELSFNDTYVEGGLEYFYVITAKNVIGESLPTVELSAIPIAVDPPLVTITSTITTIEGGQTKTTTRTINADESQGSFLMIGMIAAIFLFIKTRKRMRK